MLISLVFLDFSTDRLATLKKREDGPFFFHSSTTTTSSHPFPPYLYFTTQPLPSTSYHQDAILCRSRSRRPSCLCSRCSSSRGSSPFISLPFASLKTVLTLFLVFGSLRRSPAGPSTRSSSELPPEPSTTTSSPTRSPPSDDDETRTRLPSRMDRTWGRPLSTSESISRSSSSSFPPFLDASLIIIILQLYSHFSRFFPGSTTKSLTSSQDPRSLLPSATLARPSLMELLTKPTRSCRMRIRARGGGGRRADLPSQCTEDTMMELFRGRLFTLLGFEYSAVEVEEGSEELRGGGRLRGFVQLQLFLVSFRFVSFRSFFYIGLLAACV